MNPRDAAEPRPGIKDMGAKLTFLNKVEDATNMNKLRAELERIWASAVPLS